MNWNRISCLLAGHSMSIELEWRGHSGQSVRIVGCDRCPCRWVMSDAHHAFLRYDNDPQFIQDLKDMYPQVRNWLCW